MTPGLDDSPPRSDTPGRLRLVARVLGYPPVGLLLVGVLFCVLALTFGSGRPADPYGPRENFSQSFAHTLAHSLGHALPHLLGLAAFFVLLPFLLLGRLARWWWGRVVNAFRGTRPPL